jgi:class 3 adenylate cyclase
MEVLVGSDRFPVILTRTVGVFLVALGTVALVAIAVLQAPIASSHPGVVVVLVVLGIVIASMYLIWPRWFNPMVVWILAIVGQVGFVVLVYFAGPKIEVGVAAMVATAALCPMWFERRKAAAPIVVVMIGYAVVVTTKGYPSPLTRWLLVIGTVLVLAALLDWLMTRVRTLAIQERVTHRQLAETHLRLEAAHAELAELNKSLESRVNSQVQEIEVLNRLRRFLSPQVADAVLTGGDESLLNPHRRRIAVFFCDLRGFTTFTSGAEPEEVVEALDGYYQVVGEILHRYGATVGTFAGDGIMAYLNDPIPCDDPSRTAVEMALALREPMATFLAKWRRRGFDLGYGVGITYGYATLGRVGFESRNDYTALGSVVNLAARLCGEASPGQVLVDSRAADELHERFQLVEREVILKGFLAPVVAHEVVGA